MKWVARRGGRRVGDEGISLESIHPEGIAEDNAKRQHKRDFDTVTTCCVI